MVESEPNGLSPANDRQQCPAELRASGLASDWGHLTTVSRRQEDEGAGFGVASESQSVGYQQALSAQQADALAQLCQTCWYPLYVYIRRQGARVEDAQDLTQEFFARLLERNYLDRADPNKGKFRWFLLAALKHCLANQRERARSLKRGAQIVHIPFDEITAEKRYRLELSTPLTPERPFERAWALTLLERVREQMRDQFEKAGKRERFQKLASFFPGEHEKKSYADVAVELGTNEGALRAELHRFKAAYRQLLRTEIAHTVSTPAEVDEEFRHLIEVMQD